MHGLRNEYQDRVNFVILDYDDAGNLVSMEILDASVSVSEAQKVEFQTVE